MNNITQSTAVGGGVTSLTREAQHMTRSKEAGTQTISDNELRLRQIDSDIEQLAYLHRVRVQYAALVEAERKRQTK